jgi:hypothetical protein
MRTAEQILHDIKPDAQTNGNGSHTARSDHDANAIAESVRKAIEADKSKDNPFPLNAMPKAVQAIINHWRSVYRRPIEYHGTSMLAAWSGAIGNAFQVEYTAGTVQPLAGWFVIVGPPSSAKSPIMRACMKPLFEREKTYRKNLDDDLADWEIKKAVASQKKEKEPRKPDLEQRVVNDATIESLIKVLMQPNCWKGVIAFKDEFIGLMKGMNSYKQGGQDLEHYLSMWSGMPIILNRSGMEYAGFVDSPFVAMLGSIQPGLLNGLTDGGKIANGFLFRLLFGLAEGVKIPKGSGEIPLPEISQQYHRIVNRLIDLPTPPDRSPTTLTLDAEAYKTYTAHKEHIEQEIINKTDDEDVQSLYGKMVDYVLRIAAILELVEFVSSGDDDFFKHLSHQDTAKIKITKTAISRSITIMEYYTRNSLKILMRTESPVAALPSRQQILYEKMPTTITSAAAKEIGHKLDMSESTVKRLLYNPKLFKQQSDGNYRKLFT